MGIVLQHSPRDERAAALAVAEVEAAVSTPGSEQRSVHPTSRMLKGSVTRSDQGCRNLPRYTRNTGSSDRFSLLPGSLPKSGRGRPGVPDSWRLRALGYNGSKHQVAAVGRHASIHRARILDRRWLLRVGRHVLNVFVCFRADRSVPSTSRSEHPVRGNAPNRRVRGAAVEMHRRGACRATAEGS
jgi:hypothetical protein